ncbi:MAG: pyridoxal-phosphate dependent enzyme [Planctomycetota bacterium]
MTRLDMRRIREAHEMISPLFRDTPQYACASLGKALGCEVILKVETLNPIRCFKARGTEVAISRLTRAEDFDPIKTSAVCASAGNLGQALAFSGRARNVPTVVVASAQASTNKLERIRALGASLRLVDGDIETARHEAGKIADHEGFFLIEDSENIDTCEGAATIGLELLGYPDDLDVVLVALGGGAMATGIGHVFKQASRQTEIVCVQPAGAPAMTLSWRAKKVIETPTINTIADGVAGRCPIPEVLADLLEVADDTILTQESSLIRGMQLILEHTGLVAEPSAALGVAAVLEDPPRFAGKRVAFVLCGSNVDPDHFHKWMQQDLESRPVGPLSDLDGAINR